MPFIYKWMAVMPDVHHGLGSTIGSVIPTRGAIIPAAVGVDIGCGMMAVQTSDLLGKPVPTQQDLVDTSCYLRTAYETDLRGVLSRHGGNVKFRDDWTKIEPAELWNSAKTTMAAVN